MFSTPYETHNPQDHSIPLLVKVFSLLFSIIYVMDMEQKADSIFHVVRKVILVCVAYIACIMLWDVTVTLYHTIKIFYTLYTLLPK